MDTTCTFFNGRLSWKMNNSQDDETPIKGAVQNRIDFLKGPICSVDTPKYGRL